MTAYFLASTTGWLAVILAGCEIALPYLLRPTPLSRALGLRQSSGSTYLSRMWPHYWLGYLLLALSFAHASALMGSPLGRTNAAGLKAAAVAFLLLLIQVLLGIYLQSGAGRRRLIQRCHFWSMIAFAGLLGSHLWLNAR